MDADLGLSTATALVGELKAGRLSARELLAHYLDRVERLNPALNAVVTFDVERAQTAAAAADEAFAGGGPTGPLHGLPLTIKDAIATAGIRSTGGAVELEHHVPDADAPVVTAVKEAGAVIFGKTNVPRWSGDAQAFNAIFGTTNNPWSVDRVPGGSSGGASAAVAAGLTSFEIGTDIGGSVRLPAHFAGVCGHKPSFGVVPQLGYLDHPTGGIIEADVNVFGPIARCVADLELVFDIVAGSPPDRAVGWRLDLPGPRHDRLDTYRMAAWLDDPVCPVASDVRAALDAAVDALAAEGASIDRTARPGISLSEVWETGVPLISAATTPGRTPEEWRRAEELARGEGVDPTMAMRARATVISHRDWILLDERRQHLRRRWADFFTRFDVLLMPVAAMAAFPHNQEGNLYSRTLVVDGVTRPYADVLAWTSFVGFCYLPATVVPVGTTPDGLPVGIQIVAPFLEDRTALHVARLVEDVTGGYRPPPMAVLASPSEPSPTK